MKIAHDINASTFWTTVEGQRAEVVYDIHDDCLDILHTFVPKPLEGRGIANALVKEAYNYALANHLHPLGTCSYAKTWLARHPKYTKGPQE